MKYELTLLCRTGKEEPFQVNEIDKIIADNLMHLVAQFNILLVSLAEKEIERIKEEKHKEWILDDDIPF